MGVKFKYSNALMAASLQHSKEKVQIGSKRKIAFVCSGGATKAGAFHLGVALALQEQGFKFSGGIRVNSEPPPKVPDPMEISTYVGSSVGAIICSFLAAGYSLDNIFGSFLGRKLTAEELASLRPKRLPTPSYQDIFKIRGGMAKEQISQILRIRAVMNHLMDSNWERFLNLKWLKISGFFSTCGLEKYLREEVLISNHFQDYIPDLFIVATQLNHSSKVVFGRHNVQIPSFDVSCRYENEVEISEACAASTAIPIVFAPYPIKNKAGKNIYYIDGEIRDTLSTHVAVDNGADLVFASYTHQPYHVPESAGSLTQHGLSAIAIQSIYLLIEQKINSHIHNKKIQRTAINAVSQYCRQEGISDHHRNKICEILEKELHHRLDVDTIYIHPNPADIQTFFNDHFSLSPQRLTEIVKSGFRAAIDTLRKYEFADRKKKHAIGQLD